MKRIATLGLSLCFALSSGVAFAADKMAKADGAALYKAKCASCHGDKGMSDTPAGKAVKATNLVSAKLKNGHSVDGVTKTLNEGIPKTAMMSFKSQMKPEEVKAVAEYVSKMHK